LEDKGAEMEELSMQLLKLKSEAIDKDEQIENLFQTLSSKGEEAGYLHQ